MQIKLFSIELIFEARSGQGLICVCTRNPPLLYHNAIQKLLKESEHTHLLCYKEAVCSVVGVNHGQGVPQAIGYFLQAELQATLGVGPDPAQVLCQLFVAEQVCTKVFN